MVLQLQEQYIKNKLFRGISARRIQQHKLILFTFVTNRHPKPSICLSFFSPFYCFISSCCACPSNSMDFGKRILFSK